MTDYKASLDLVVNSSGVSAADRGLKSIEAQGAKAERATDGVGAAFTRIIAPIASFISVGAGLRKVTDVTRQFDVFKASLETATGSAGNANIAFAALEDFAKRTPYALEQTVEGFVQLTNLGLNPSERAMESFGNTAAAMGKDLNQFVEAVADATTNEFERLKEFGIKASQDADNVSFTFRGVTQTIKKDSESIQEYLIKLGETNFAGAMEKRMDSLDGAISNLGDTWDGVFRSIGENGVGDVIEESVRFATESLEEFQIMLESGQITAGVDAIGTAFSGFADDAAESLDILTNFIHDTLREWGLTAGDAGRLFTDNIDLELSHIPENIRTMIKLAVVEIASIVDYGTSYGGAFAKAFGVQIAKLVDQAGVVANEIKDRLNVFDGDTYDFEAAMAQASKNASELTDSYFKEAEKQADATRNARRDSILAIMDEAEASKKATDKKVEGIRAVRVEWEKLQKTTKKATIDDVSNDTPKPKPETEEFEPSKEFSKLIDNVIPPEDRINHIFERRLALIQKNTEDGSQKQKDLIERLNREYATDILDGYESEIGEYDFDSQIDKVNEEFAKRKQQVLDNTKLLASEKSTLEKTLAKQHAKELNEIESKRFDAQMGIAKSALGNLSTLMNSESEKAFKIGKIAAIANATISGIEATVHAYKFGSQVGGPVLGATFAATAAAATAVQIQQLKSQQFGGGATVSAGGGSAPTNVYQPEQPSQPVGAQGTQQSDRPINLILHKDFNGQPKLSIEEQLDEFRDYIEDTDYVFISSTSRNGQELAA